MADIGEGLFLESFCRWNKFMKNQLSLKSLQQQSFWFGGAFMNFYPAEPIISSHRFSIVKGLLYLKTKSKAYSTVFSN